MGPFRQFNEFWDTLSEASKLRMNKGDVEFGWLAASSDIKPAKLQGRRDALIALYWEMQTHDYFKEAQMVKSFYKTDICNDNYFGEKENDQSN